MAGPALPINGHRVVKTPHIESLAEGGVAFRNAYCNNPICASSRFTFRSKSATRGVSGTTLSAGFSTWYRRMRVR